MSPESRTPQPAQDIDRWLGEARAGSQEALGRLLETCRHYLLLANQALGPALWAKVAPSDVVQETLLEAGRNFLAFHGGGEEELLAWIRGILGNNLADVQPQFEADKRQSCREVFLAETPLEELRHCIIDPADSPSGQALTHERDEQMERALQQLPEHYRQVLVLHTRDGLSFAAIVERLDSTAEAVRKLWGRTLKELADRLEMPHDST